METWWGWEANAQGELLDFSLDFINLEGSE